MKVVKVLAVILIWLGAIICPTPETIILAIASLAML